MSIVKHGNLNQRYRGIDPKLIDQELLARELRKSKPVQPDESKTEQPELVPA